MKKTNCDDITNLIMYRDISQNHEYYKPEFVIPLLIGNHCCFSKECFVIYISCHEFMVSHFDFVVHVSQN